MTKTKLKKKKKSVCFKAQNLACSNATLADAGNNENGGLTTIHSDSFLMPNEILSTAFNLTDSNVNSIRKNLPPTVSRGTVDCLRRCGL